VLTDDAFQFFAASPLPSYHLVHQAANNTSDPVFDAVNQALASIDRQILDEVKGDPVFLSQMSLSRDMDLDAAARQYALIRYLSREIPPRRYHQLRTQDQYERPDPYTHPALLDLELSEDYLVPTREFDTMEGVLYRNGYAFAITPPVESVNSAYWLHQALRRETVYRHAYVRLDPFLYGPADTYPCIGYRMWVYGQPLDWQRLARLKEAEHGQWLPDDLTRSGVQHTEYVWSPRGTEVHFRCEEIPTCESLNSRGSRYFHAIYDREEEHFSHIDGAVRLYSDSEWRLRNQTHLRQAGKVGQRIKIFRIDVAQSREAFCDICPSFFVWNEDVQRYFDADQDLHGNGDGGHASPRKPAAGIT